VKKIQRKTSSGKDVSAIFSMKSHTRRFLYHGEENTGYILVVSPFSVQQGISGGSFVYRFVACLNHGVTQTFETVANKEAIHRTISAMTGISVMVEIILQ
jgi:hypothetical protein